MAAARGYLVRARKQNAGHKSSKGSHRKKKPPWDNSISNLLVYKPTQDELKRRHELHQPIPRDLLDSMYDDSDDYLKSRNAVGQLLRTPDSVSDERASILREMMDSNEKLQEALTYSDKRLSTVQDLFGDDPKKFRGFPNITSAPCQTRDMRATLIKEPALGASNLDILSDTVMDDTALNDLDDVRDENNNVAEERNPSCKRSALETQPPLPGTSLSSPSIDACVGDAAVSDAKTRSPSAFTRSSLTTTASDLQGHTQLEMKDRQVSRAAMPDVEKAQEQSPVIVRKLTKSKNGVPETGLSGLHDLRQMVDDLEEEVNKYEQETGRIPRSFNPRKDGNQSVGGFTASILNAVTKLVGYLRECERQRKDDMAVQEEMFHGFGQQQILIDVLTNDVIYTKEENKKLRHELETYRAATNQEIANLKEKRSRMQQDNEKLSGLEITRTSPIPNIAETESFGRKPVRDSSQDFREVGSLLDKQTHVEGLLPVSMTSEALPGNWRNQNPVGTFVPPSLPPENALRPQSRSVLQSSVFLGRNHSMSPGRFTTTFPQKDEVHGHEERPVPLFAKPPLEVNLDEMENTSTKQLQQMTSGLEDSCSGTRDVRRQIFSNDDRPKNIDFRTPPTGPTVSPSVLDVPHGRSASRGDKMVVTIPSMWQDAETKSHEHSKRENTARPLRSEIKSVGKQSNDQGWFALSTYTSKP